MLEKVKVSNTLVERGNGIPMQPKEREVDRKREVCDWGG